MERQTKIAITNNDMVIDSVESVALEFVEGDASNVLLRVRDLVHKGFVLVSHPSAGSLKPDESPYRTVLVAPGDAEVDFRSLAILESALDATRKFRRRWAHMLRSADGTQAQKIKDDMKTLDLLLFKSALDS